MRQLIFMTLLMALGLNAETKIAVVELEKAVNEVHDGKAARAKLEEEFKKKQELLDKKQTELKKLQDTFQSQAAVMKEEARQTKGMELQTKFAEAQQLYGNMQQDMVKKQQESMGEILKKMNPIVQDMAKKGGYVAVLNKTEMTVLYADPSLNLTDEVIKRYNASYPAALPAPKKKK